MSWIQPISELRPEDLAQYGGKAASLARLHARKLPVPPAIAVSAQAWQAFLRHNGLQDDARRLLRSVDPESLQLLRQQICAGTLPPELAGPLRQHSAQLGERLVVRSSAIEEDGAEHSFAGQFISLLNIRPGDPVENALRECWASLYSLQAATYRQRAGGPVTDGMGVVIQRLVDSRCAGVLFTVNPVTGSWRESVVEAAWGQGEALVSGQVAPDRYLVRRPRRQLKGTGRLMRRLRVQEVEADVVPQPRRLAPTTAGQLSWVPVAEPEARKLSPKEVERLARLGLKVERMAGCPQDLEWALDHQGELYVLQARPITAAGEPPRGEEVLWTRRFFGERWTTPATPLGWSITSEVLRWFVDYPSTSARFLGGAPPLRLLRGHPYVNVTVFRHLAFKLPGRPPPSFIMDLLPPDEQHRWTHRFAYPPDLRVYRSILATTLREQRWRRFRWNPLTNHRAWDQYRRRLDEELPKLAEPAPDLPAALAQADQGIALLREYLKVHIISLLLANLLYQWGQSTLPPDLRDDLLISPADNPTVQTNQALYELAHGGDLDAFLEKYGHRSSEGSWELFSPRWIEEPQRVLALAQAQKHLPDPAELARDHAERAQDALDELRRRLSPAQGFLVLAALRLTRRHLQLREEQRFHFDRLSLTLKRSLLRVGALLFPQDPTLIRWLQWPELQDLAVGKLPRLQAEDLVQLRQQQWAEDRRQPAPPVFLLGDTGVEVESGSRTLHGLGISSGRATGAVRILHSPDEAHRLQPGEILVATATDPGWTPLFLVAGGLILELGSMLSHGAVVAREYRLPAVVNLSQATSRLRDGQRVTVDGSRGIVWLEET